MSEAQVIRAQVSYRQSEASLITAQKIILAKLRHCERLLTHYARSRRRAGNDAARQLLQNQVQIKRLQQRLIDTNLGRQKIFQTEALATRFYWDSLRLICHQGEIWHRVHPHASDALNLALNTGYVTLARRCREALLRAGLLLEIGVLHSDNSQSPLIYDFMEPFRQPLVDRVIIPFFSRRSVGQVAVGDPIFKKIFWQINNIYSQTVRYNKNEKWERVLYLEAVKLKQAILTNAVWRPVLYRWGHHRK